MKKIASFFAGLINWIKKIAKFLASGIGMIPLFLIAVVMILILVYILVYVIGKSVAGMLGIDAPGADEYKTDAEFLQSLTNSGYDELIDAKQLMRYYSFEYSTLMDAARYLEEVGTTKIAKEDTATINCRELDRKQWAKIVAETLTGGSVGGGSESEKEIRADQEAAGTAPKPYTEAELEPTTECSENDLLYFRTYNEYTKQYCLMPYLCLTRVDDDLTFFFEIRGIDEEEDYKSKGKNNLQDTVTVNGQSMSLAEFITTVKLRFNTTIPGGMSKEAIVKWVEDHVFPSGFNLLLNKANKAAFEEGDARYDGLTKSPVDLMMDYDKYQNIYYTTDELEVPYKIPLRILLDRFLPNASLLSAWRHLSDDEVLKKKMGEDLGQNLVDELLKIYSEACLKDESMTSGGTVEEIISTSGDTKPKEIQIASSNNETFAKFETTLLKSTTFREWRFATAADKRLSNEDWFVDDAFEELESNLDNITVTYDITWVGLGGENGGTGTGEHTFSKEELGALIGFDYDDINNKVKIADEMVLDYTVTEENFIDKRLDPNTKTVIRRHDTDSDEHTDHDYSQPPTDPAALEQGVTRCDEESPNAMLDSETAAAFDWHGTGTSTGAMYGEATNKMSYIELVMKTFGVAPGEEFNTTKSVKLKEVDQLCNSSSALKSILEKEAGIRNVTTETYTVECYPVISNIRAVHNMSINYCVAMPTHVAVSMISQRVIDKTLPNGYFVRDANYWAADKKFNNTYVVCGEYLEEDREKIGFLFSRNSQAQGILDIKSDFNPPQSGGKEVYANWRCKLFAPIFAGLTENDLDSGREADVELVLSEWETVANNGVNAADHAMRDLYYLINYSKGILNEGVDVVKQSVSDDDFVANFKPLKQADGTTSLINVGSYTYLYLPDEIIMFNPLSCEKIFWLDRIVTTPDDRVDDDNENKMRSRLLTFTWQVVDYDLYEETEAESHGVDGTDGKHYVYAMWPYGDQLTRLMYAIDSNSSVKEHEYVKNWGGYSDVHKAADLYGRAIAQKIYNSVYGEPKGQKEKVVFNEFYGYGYDRYTGGVSSITSIAEISDDATTPTTTPTTTPDPSQKIEYDDVMLDSGTEKLLDSDENAPVTLLLGGTRYHFKGPAAAAFGYELYRQTVVEEDGKKAERIVKDQLEKELQWTEIRAQVPGIVTDIRSNANSGFAVTVQHSGYNEESANNTFTTSYVHMKRYPLVQVGQYVGPGTVIGYEGTTGYSLGYHLHTGYSFSGLKEADSPVRYLYPFFTPFFYEDQAKKAKDAAGNSGFLSSEYWSTVRTVFPYGQIVDSSLVQTLKSNKDHNGLIGHPYEMAKDDEFTKTVDIDTLGGENIVKIQNYTPQYPVLTDVKMLATPENAEDLSRINTTGNIMREAGKSEWDKDLLTTDPDYVDEGFIKQVEGNDNKIKGLK